MNRSQRIQQAIWTLLRLIEEPRDAVVTAKDLLQESNLKPTEITSILRATGAFAKDEKSYFLRYNRGGKIQQLQTPKPTHCLTMPVPVEPRMRIAYSVFSGLLLKYLYQEHGVIPIEVSDGFARLWALKQFPNADKIWAGFRRSSIAETAIKDGIEAALNAVPRRIGALPLTETLIQSVVWETIKQTIPRRLPVFQAQSGKVPNFISRGAARDSTLNESFDQIVNLCIKGERSISESGEIFTANLLHKSVEDGILKEKRISELWDNIKSDQKIDTTESEKTLWQVWDDRLKQASLGETKKEKEKLKKLKEIGKTFDSQLRQNVLLLQEFIIKRCESSQHFLQLITGGKQKAVQLIKAKRIKKELLDLTALINEIEENFKSELIFIPIGRKPAEYRRKSIELLVKATLAVKFAHRLPEPPNGYRVILENWGSDVLKKLDLSDAYILTLLEIDGKRVRIGNTLELKLVKAKQSPIYAPFTLLESTDSFQMPPHSNLTQQLTLFENDREISGLMKIDSGKRCIVCRSDAELLKGTKSFLPESKKFPYDKPVRKEEPWICSSCAFVAYLSSIYPHDEMCIVEFQMDNYMELFGHHEALRGISGLQALKAINRVANLSVFPNRYLLLSLRNSSGKIDTKTQLYLQLKAHPHLIKQHERPMRVHVGGETHDWTEIHPFVAIGLGHFRNLPFYYNTDGVAKAATYEIVDALTGGRVYTALYRAICYTQNRTDEKDVRESDVFKIDLKTYESEFVCTYQKQLTQAAGGISMSSELYEDIIGFSTYLFELTGPLVREEVSGSSSNVSVVARKYTNLIEGEFSEGLAARFLYAVAQEADAAARPPNEKWWVKQNVFKTLYGAEPPKGSGVEAAKAWEQFCADHPKTQLEINIEKFYKKYGGKTQNWKLFLREVELRTLSLLLLHVRQQPKSQSN